MIFNISHIQKKISAEGTQVTMMNSNPCPKCENKEVKLNHLGWMQSMALGNIYRCTKCGYSEIWNPPKHHKQINILFAGSILIALGAICWVMYGIYTV
jgi:predicted nucleic-acid-binding Zn-ribbon protein